MRLHEALNQIAEIHSHLARVEVYRGFRSLPVALSGLCGLVAAVAQARGWTPTDGRPLVIYWTMVSLVSAAVGGCEIAYNYIWRDGDLARRRTRRVLAQFVPCLAAGIAVTYALARLEGWGTDLLPGLWALLFGLGIFAARPFLPRAIGWVALSYLVAGAVLLAQAEGVDYFEGWRVGVTFAVGQTACALVLYWNLERSHEPHASA